MTVWISSCLAAWVRLVLRFRKLTSLVGLVGGSACLYYAGNNLGINTDTADMISPELAWRQDFIEYRESFEVRERNIVIVIDGGSPEQADAAAAGFAAALRRRPELFRAVFAAGEGEFFERNGLLYLSVQELEALGDRLAAAQPLLGRMQQRFDGARFIEVIEEGVRRASGPETTLDLLYGELNDALLAASDGGRRMISWQELVQGENSGPRRFVLVQPNLDFSRVQPGGAAMDGIRELIQTLPAAQAEGVRIRLTGTVAMEHEELASVSQGAALAGAAAFILVAAILYIALRSLVLLLVSVTTLIVGLSGTAAFAAAAVGHLNLLSVAFAVLYIGLGVDFIVHVLLRLKELMAQGLDVDEALIGSVRGVGASLVICAVTTAAGFYAFIPTPFQGVSELGLISGTGMFISLIVSVSLLPALTAQFWRGEGAKREPRWLGARVLDPMLAHPRAVTIAAAVIAVAATVTLPSVSFDRNPIHLRDPETESVATLLELAAEGEALPLHLVAVATDGETIREWSQALSELSTVAKVSSLDSLVPEDQSTKLLILQDIDLLMGPGFAQVEREASSPSDLGTALAALDRALSERSASSEAQTNLSNAIQRFLTSLDELSEAMRTSRLLDLEQDLIGTLPGQLGRLANGLRAEPFDRDALPESLKIRWLGPDQRELVEIAAAENINDNLAAERFVDSVRSVVASATGLPVVHQEAGRTVVQALQLAFLYALVMVSVILGVFLRNFGDSVLVIVPIFLAAGVTAAWTVVLGLEFNFANIIALPLLLGVGVDNGIHMVHRMRTEPPTHGGLIDTSTSKAVLVSGLTTVASFGNLAFSPHPGMASMGQLLTLGMMMTLAATLILLPALLKLRGAA